MESWKIVHQRGGEAVWQCKMPSFFSFFELLPKLFLVWRAQLIPILVKRARSGVCLCEMLGLRIKVSDTFGFRIRMRRKKGGLLVEIIKHQGKIISLGLRKLTTKYALCLHVQHIYMKITKQSQFNEISWDVPPRFGLGSQHLEITEFQIVKKTTET